MNSSSSRPSLQNLKDRVNRSAKKANVSSFFPLQQHSQHQQSSSRPIVAMPFRTATNTNNWTQTPRTLKRDEQVQANNVRNVVHAQVKVAEELVRVHHKWQEAKLSLQELWNELPEAAETSTFWLGLFLIEEQRTNKDRETMLNLLQIALEHVPGSIDRVQLMEAILPYLRNSMKKDLPIDLQSIFMGELQNNGGQEIRRLSFVGNSMNMNNNNNVEFENKSPRPSPMKPVILASTMNKPIAQVTNNNYKFNSQLPENSEVPQRSIPMSASKKLPSPKFNEEDDTWYADETERDVDTTTSHENNNDPSLPSSPELANKLEELVIKAETTTSSNQINPQQVPATKQLPNNNKQPSILLLQSPALRVPTPLKRAAPPTPLSLSSSRSLFEDEFLEDDVNRRIEQQQLDEAENVSSSENIKPQPLLGKSPKLVKKMDSIMKLVKSPNQPLVSSYDVSNSGSQIVYTTIKNGKDRTQRAATPVRRSTRPSVETTSVNLSLRRALEESNYSYKPNHSLERLS
jgi:hypothetical protein